MLDPERTLDAMQALQIPVQLKKRLQSSFRKFYLMAQGIEDIAKSGILSAVEKDCNQDLENFV
jgi:hypothetical protein